MRMLEIYQLGPSEFKDGLEPWARNAKDCLGQELQKGVYHLRQKGNIFYTDCSSIKRAKWGWQDLCLAFDDPDIGNPCTKPFEHWARTCDIGNPQAAFLVQMHWMNGNDGCHLEDIVQRTHATAQDYIQGCRPAKGSFKEQRAEAYDELLRWLQENRGWAYPPRSEAKQKRRSSNNTIIKTQTQWISITKDTTTNIGNERVCSSR